MNSPEISVLITTYNHRDYINKAVDSVLSQKVNFPYEIIIGDDFSTDGTREILKAYSSKHPNEIKLNLLPERGKGMVGRQNHESSLALCRGKYIAFLDGDDYWTDTGKLQYQHEFLEDNEDYVLCHHDCDSVLTEGVELKKKFNKENHVTGFYEACQITQPFMSSVLIRREALTFYDQKKYLEGLDLGDFVYWIMASLKGKFYYDDRQMSFYRINPNSVTKSLGMEVQVRNRIVLAERLMSSDFNFDRKFLKNYLSRYYFLWSGINLSKRKFTQVIKYNLMSIVFALRSISLKTRKYKWVNRLKFRSLLRIYLANIKKSFSTV